MGRPERTRFRREHLRSDTGITRSIKSLALNFFSEKFLHLLHLTQSDLLNSLLKTHSQLTLTRSVNSRIFFVFPTQQILSPLNTPLMVNSLFTPTKTSLTMLVEQPVDSTRSKTTQTMKMNRLTRLEDTAVTQRVTMTSSKAMQMEVM